MSRSSKRGASGEEPPAEEFRDVEARVFHGSRFQDDQNMLLDMFFGDFEEVADLVRLRDWVSARATGRRTKSRVSNETRLAVSPSAGTVTVSGRWDPERGEKSMSVENFVELCDDLIERGRPD